MTTCTCGPYLGREAAWFSRALRSREGRIQAGGLQRDVTFSEPDDIVHHAIDQTYLTKYGRYPDSYVQPMIGPDATQPRSGSYRAERSNGRRGATLKASYWH